MSILTDIKEIVESVKPDSTYKFSSYFKANVKAHGIKKEELPYIIFDNELAKTAQIMKNANIQKDTRIRIYFLNLDNPKNDDEEREAIRLAMENIADRVMVRVYQLTDLRVIGTGNQVYRIDPVFNAFSTDLSGVVAEMQANFNNIVNWC